MKKKILVVDDNPSILKGIEMVLKSAGYTTKISLNHDDTIDLARGFEPDVILLDRSDTEAKTMAIADLLRNESQTSSVPIIGIFSQISEKLFPSHYTDTFSAKPFRSSHLLELINKYC